MNKNKNVKRLHLVFIMFMLITLSFPIQIYATQPATDEEGYVIDNGSGNNSSITDAMRNYKDTTTPDDEAMKRTISWSNSHLGLVLSCIIWIYFAAIAFTTACDLAFISLPGLRPTLTNFATNDAKNLINTQSQNNQTQQQQNIQQQSMNGQTNIQEIRPVQTTNATNIKEYFKRRIVSIIMAVTILLVFVSSSVFTDLGFNIGEAILRFLGF